MSKERNDLIAKLDKVFSQYIRIKYSDESGYCKCVTCGAYDHYKDFDCGHFVPRKHLATRWDEENAYPQCKHCNQYLSGNIEKYEEFLGGEKANELRVKGRQVSPLRIPDLKLLLTEINNKKDEQKGF